MKKLFTVFAIIFCGIWATTTSKAELTDFYTYTDNGAGYKVSLTKNFRAQLDKASGGELISGDITWRTGDPLPNPAPDGMYNGVPVVSMDYMFAYCSSITSLDLSSFNTSKVTDMGWIFYECGKATNGKPAVGYAKDAATAAIFNNEWGTYINLSRLEFMVKTSGIVSENDTKTLQLRGNVLYNPTGSEVVVYTVNGQKILVSSDTNIDLSNYANAAYVAQSEAETIKIAL